MGCEESKVDQPPTPAEWDPYSYLDHSIACWDADRRAPFALVILNQAITNTPLFLTLWKNGKSPPAPPARARTDAAAARLRVCADGGANRLFDALSERDREKFVRPPPRPPPPAARAKQRGGSSPTASSATSTRCATTSPTFTSRAACR